MCSTRSRVGVSLKGPRLVRAHCADCGWCKNAEDPHMHPWKVLWKKGCGRIRRIPDIGIVIRQDSMTSNPWNAAFKGCFLVIEKHRLAHTENKRLPVAVTLSPLLVWTQTKYWLFLLLYLLKPNDTSSRQRIKSIDSIRSMINLLKSVYTCVYVQCHLCSV